MSLSRDQHVCASCGYPRGAADLCTECGKRSFVIGPLWWHRVKTCLDRVGIALCALLVPGMIIALCSDFFPAEGPRWVGLIVLLLILAIPAVGLLLFALCMVRISIRFGRLVSGSPRLRFWFLSWIAAVLFMVLSGTEVPKRLFVHHHASELDRFADEMESALVMPGVLYPDRNVAGIKVAKVQRFIDGSLWFYADDPRRNFYRGLIRLPAVDPAWDADLITHGGEFSAVSLGGRWYFF